jgi:hypothetical protein
MVALLGVSVAAGCTGKAPDKDAPAGCAKDTDCKGNRVCVSGSCQDAPAAAQSGSPAQAPATTRAPAATTSPSAEPSPAFRPLVATDWVPRIGKRLRVGAKVAHQVFEGPLGPSPRSIFVVTQEGEEFYATVWADDHGYRAGPLANNGGRASKIPAVSFFDADGDGAMDALVMATYIPAAGGPEHYDNVLLRWNGTALVRMVNLEPAIAGLESVAAIRAKLKR